MFLVGRLLKCAKIKSKSNCIPFFLDDVNARFVCDDEVPLFRNK